MLENRTFIESDAHEEVLPKLYQALSRLQPSSLIHLSDWFGGYEAEALSELVSVVQQFITLRILTHEGDEGFIANFDPQVGDRS